MNEGVNLDAVNASLRSVKLLRCNVRDLFRHLTDGSDQNFSNSEQKEDNNFINDLQQLVGSVNQRVRELENSCSALTNGLTDQTVTLGEHYFYTIILNLVYFNFNKFLHRQYIFYWTRPTSRKNTSLWINGGFIQMVRPCA